LSVDKTIDYLKMLDDLSKEYERYPKKSGKLVCGWGINDADYKVRPNNGYGDTSEWCPYYGTWYAMISRCYGSLSKRDPTNVREVCNEWKKFTVFKDWMKTQDWEGKSLDKDILTFGGSLYSPDTCIFVADGLNSYFSRSKKSDLPYGVTKGVNKDSSVVYRAKDVFNNKSNTCLTVEKAHKIWQISKMLQIRNLKNVYEMEDRLASAVYKYSETLEQDIINNRITEHFPWK